MKLFEYIFKVVILICVVLSTFLFYQINVKSNNGRYQIIENSTKIIDTKTGKIYFYNGHEGYYYYEGWGVKHLIKQLPQ